MRTVAGILFAGVLVAVAIAYQSTNQRAPEAAASPPRFDPKRIAEELVTESKPPDRVADELAKEHPEPAIPGHYPDGCVGRRHRWVVPVQGYVLDWCAIESRTDGKGNGVATAYVDSPIQRGFMEKTHRVVRYDFDCAGHFSVDLSPPMPLSVAGTVSAAYLIGNAVCVRASQLLSERAH
jgi:hypothetical protein